MLETIEELDIDELFDRLKEKNGALYNWTQDDSDLDYPISLEEAEDLSDLISGKPRVIRENYFSRRTKTFTEALVKEDYSTAHKIITDLKYFAHCFLQDSNIGKDTRTETLKLIAESIS